MLILLNMNSWQSFRGRNHRRDDLYFFEEHGAQTFYTPRTINPNSIWFSGVKSAGLPPAILDGMNDRVFNLPMLDTRGTVAHLANVATAVVYQAMRNSVWVGECRRLLHEVSNAGCPA